VTLSNIDNHFGRDLVEPLLRRVLQAIVIAATLIAVSSAVLGIPRIAVSSLLNAIVAVFLMALVRKGHLLAASLIQCAMLTASTIFAIVIGYGLLDVAILTLPALYLLVSVLLSARWIVVVMLITDATVVSVGLAEKFGWLVTPTSALVGYDDIIDAVVLLTTTAAFVHYLVSTLRRSIVQARVAQARTRDILDATSDAIVIHDADTGELVEANETTLRMFETSRDALLAPSAGTGGTKTTDEYIAQAFEFVRRAVSDGPQSFEWSTQGKHGEASWFEVILRAATIGDERRVVAVLRDITARRQLEQRVCEAEKFRAVGQLAGGIAHDFNNQLVAILGNAEFMRDIATNDPELRACADSVLASGQRAADLTRQLLAFARRARRNNVPVDLHQLILEVIALARRSIDKRVTIEQRLEAEYVVTVGDSSALQNALLNLLLNARDAMPAGGTVSFTTHNMDVPANGHRHQDGRLAPGKYIELDVSDTGVGIGPNIRDRIFEPFFTTKSSGTGMGLAAVQGTVLEHQGAVEVASGVGVGSTFRLLLPVSTELRAVESTRASLPAASQNQGRILVVDDEPSVASVIKHALEHSGYGVDCCNRGQQALERYRADTYDLVLLDVVMPDLDGVEVLGRLRQSHSGVRVIIMTGHAPESIQSRLHDYPDVPVLAKPFLKKELLHEVRELLSRAIEAPVHSGLASMMPKA
jgi:PAS domain S-box-containing protein